MIYVSAICHITSFSWCVKSLISRNKCYHGHVIGTKMWTLWTVVETANFELWTDKKEVQERNAKKDKEQQYKHCFFDMFILSAYSMYSYPFNSLWRKKTSGKLKVFCVSSLVIKLGFLSHICVRDLNRIYCPWAENIKLWQKKIFAEVDSYF